MRSHIVRHELHLARAGFLALAVIAAAAIALGSLVDGANGARSAAIGAGLVAANHAVAVLSTSWSRSLSARVLAVGYGVFTFRMLFVLGVFGTLATIPWINDGLLAGTFCAALVASLTAECVSYVRGSYVPAWMRRQAPLAHGRTR
jgi:hypothetical protein